jgi:hypothetical protein
MHRCSRRLKPACGDAAPTADAFVLVDVDDSPPAIDPPGSVPQRAGEVAVGENTLLAHVEEEVIAEGIADDI